MEQQWEPFKTVCVCVSVSAFIVCVYCVSLSAYIYICVYVRVRLIRVHMFHLAGTAVYFLLGYHFVPFSFLHAHIGAPHCLRF